MRTTTIQFDSAGESQEFASEEGRVFFRRDQDGEISVCDAAEGQPVFGEFANQYVTFATVEEAEAFAAHQGLTPTEG